MKDFVLYHKGNDGVLWYRCTACGYLVRGKATECPVCQGKGRMKSEEERSENNDSTNGR